MFPGQPDGAGSATHKACGRFERSVREVSAAVHTHVNGPVDDVSPGRGSESSLARGRDPFRACYAEDGLSASASVSSSRPGSPSTACGSSSGSSPPSGTTSVFTSTTTPSNTSTGTS